MGNYLYGTSNYFSESMELVREFIENKKNTLSKLIPLIGDGNSGNCIYLPGDRINGLTTKEIAVVFDKIKWSRDRWGKNLSSAKWLHNARVFCGSAGGASSVWNPYIIFILIVDRCCNDGDWDRTFNSIRNRFGSHLLLKPWSEQFDEWVRLNCDDC